MSATVTVSKARNGKFRVTLASSRGKELLVSDPFTDKRAAAGVVRSLKGVLPSDTTFVDSTSNGNGRATTAAATTATRRPRRTK
jgi:uncharacterized protein YegP (UPF0339 family)